MMARIPLTEGFSIIPEGIHVFQIKEVTYKADFGKLEIAMQTAKGQKHVERYSLMTKDNTPNDGAMNAFSYFAKTALNDFSLTEIDEQDLVGRYIKCEVTHEQVESNRTPGKMVTFVRLGDKAPADGFEGEASPAPAAEPKAKPAIDLGALLG